MEREPFDESTFPSLSHVLRNDRLCDQFEAAWKAGQRPRLSDFLREAPPAEWPELLRELLTLDLDYRRQLGESPTREQYRVEYPALDLDGFASLFAAASQSVASSLSGATAEFTASNIQTSDGQLPRIRYLGDYELLEEIARGGMGVVYKARQVSLNRVVAVKLILAGQLATKADHDRFHSEAQAAALLDHPNIVPVFEVGEHEGQHYFSMGYVDGQSLAVRLAKGPLPPKEAAELAATVGEAVEYAHRQGVIHRDIKPSNILIDGQRRPRVTDFGLAKRIDSGSHLTATGQVLGTPNYMSPEQAAGQFNAVGPAADVYALGATLYAALTGRPPFQAATPLETLQQVLACEPAALRQLNPGVPRDLETIALKCLEKSAPRRYSTAQALVEDLRRYLEGRPILARSVGRLEHSWRWCQRQPLVAGLAAAAVLLMVLVAVAITAGYVSTSRALHQVADAQKARALAQVETLRTAEISKVPDLIEEVKPFRVEIVPQLRQALLQPGLSDKERLRLSLAMVAEDEGQVAYLTERLLSAEPADLLVIRAELLPYRDKLAPSLWRTVDDPAAAKDRRFRAACALATFDPASPHWTNTGKPVVEALVAEDPLRTVVWVEALRPVWQSLRPALQTVFRDRKRNDAIRLLTASILADYAAGRSGVLADLLMDGDEVQFPIIYRKLKARSDEALPYLQNEVEKPMPEATEELKEALAKRRANAAIALLKLNHAAKVWPLLKHSPDPTARSYLIHSLAPLGVDVMLIVHRLNEETDVSSRRTLILCLGEFDTAQFPAAGRKSLIAKLLDTFRNEPDPGLHGAVEWLLRQKGWDRGDELSRIDAQSQVDEKQHQARKATDRRKWYVNTEGQTFVILNAAAPLPGRSPAGELGRQTPHAPYELRSGRTFSIDSKIVTKSQFRHFQQANPDVATWDLDKFIPSDDCPQVDVDWCDAARYCNWLSKIEGIPKEQWCYEPNAQGEYAAGMKPAADFLQRVGYRLPTEAEWEHACRAGTTTNRYYGLGVKLLPNYAWFLDNSEEHPWPAGMKKPNDYGLFDMLGNVWEWCENDYESDAALKNSGTKVGAQENVRRAVRGGSYGFQAWGIRSDYNQLRAEPTRRADNLGFRVARTCR